MWEGGKEHAAVSSACSHCLHRTPQPSRGWPKASAGCQEHPHGITFLMGQPQEGGTASCKLITDRALSPPHSHQAGEERFMLPALGFLLYTPPGWGLQHLPTPRENPMVRPHAAYNSAFQNSAPIIRKHPSMDGENTSTTVPPVHSFSPLPATGHVLSSSW